MLSDGTRVAVPLARLACRRCGMATLRADSVRRLPRRLFGVAYRLNAGPPSAMEIERQAGYAARVASLVGLVPESVLDVGCGNGALLLALGRIWPAARLGGVEPAPGAAASGRRAGLPIAANLSPLSRAALVLSVNVIEHTPDPLAFLRRLRAACLGGGRVLVICPDGSEPWLELAMADHRHSLTPAALACLAERAGFAVMARQSGTGGGFQAILLRASRARPLNRVTGSATALLTARRHYMAARRSLDARLLARRDPDRRLVCFGVGEAARLLRAYAPRVWQAVTAVTADDLAGADDLGKPVLSIQRIDGPSDEVLLAVRPGAQPALTDRFVAAGGQTLRWDAIVPR